MRPRFEPDSDSGVHTAHEAQLVDPESFEASEEQFTASLEEKPPVPAPTFVPDGELVASRYAFPKATDADPQDSGQPIHQPSQPGLLQEPDDSWRREVASRVNRYRARRRAHSPRYPSLQLEFEPAERSRESGATRESSPYPASNLSVARHPELAPDHGHEVQPEASGKLLSFPRMAVPPPPVRLDELADPIFDRPRIMEVPEVAPPPPALGGILIDSAEDTLSERRPGFELPLQAAPMSRRVAAVLTDGALVALALAGFEYSFFRITSFIPPLVQSAGVSAALAGSFWFGYQYLQLVFSGTTPGLRLAKLRLSCFDGSAVPRRLRRWRVLASALSGLSLGLGYAWCFLDEDQLCWHDRITKTYMAPVEQRKELIPPQEPHAAAGLPSPTVLDS